MTSPKKRPGPESTLDDVREQLVAAATADLRDRGVDIGLAHIKLSDAIVAAGVTRTTAYRSLASDNLAPQDVLHREVLGHVLKRNARDANLAIVGEAVAKEMERQDENFRSDDVAKRTAAMRGLIRVGADMSYESVCKSTERSVLTAAYGALQSSQTTDWRVDALKAGEANVTLLFSELFLNLSTMFDYRLRPEYSIAAFGTAAAASVEGLAMRDGLNPNLLGIERPTGPDGEVELWTLNAVVFEAMYVQFFEPGSADAPFADLLRY